jgi:hypothetical protein
MVSSESLLALEAHTPNLQQLRQELFLARHQVMQLRTESVERVVARLLMVRVSYLQAFSIRLMLQQRVCSLTQTTINLSNLLVERLEQLVAKEQLSPR